MLTTGNPTTDAAVVDALALRTRRIQIEVLIDWNRNGLYNHAYSDLSTMVQSVSSERADDLNLPQEVNSLSGAAAGEATVVLAGKRYEDPTGPRASELFDPYNGNSPIYGVPIIIAPITVNRVMWTALGDVRYPVITGFIRSAPFKRKSGEVTIEIVDHMDILGGTASLPRWAAQVSPPPDRGGEWWGGDVNQEAKSIQMSWVLEEICRQSGRPVGPSPRSDAAVYHTFSGAMLPSYGYGSMADGTQLPTVVHGSPGSAAGGNIWRPATENMGAYTAPWIPAGYDGYSWCSANKQVVVPVHGSAQSPGKIGWSVANVFIPPSSGNGSRLRSVMYLEDFRRGGLDNYPNFNPTYPTTGVAFYSHDYNAGYLMMEVTEDGAIKVGVYENSTPGYGTNREWTWENSSNLTPNAWYNINVILSFTNSSITLSEIRVNGSIVSTTQTGNSGARGFTYTSPDYPPNPGGGLANGRTNVTLTFSSMAATHVQWYSGPPSTAYNTDQFVQKKLPNGKPGAVIGPSLVELIWIPEVYRSLPWSTLKDVASGEFGTLWVDEYGTIRFLARTDTQSISQNQVVTAIDLTDEQLDEMMLTPTADSLRNRITGNYNRRVQQVGLIWQQGAVTDHFAAIGQSRSEIYALNEPVTGVFSLTGTVRDPNIGWNGGPDAGNPGTPDEPEKLNPYTQYARAVKAANQTQAAIGFGNGIVATPDQRSMTILWSQSGGAGTADSYVGAKFADSSSTPTPQPYWFVFGRKYSDSSNVSFSYTDTASVATYGTQTLQLPDSDWMQTSASANAVSQSLLLDTKNPVPLIEVTDLPADPRRQIHDVIRITNEAGTSGVLYGQIIKKATNDSGGNSTDSLTLRVMETPKSAIWDAVPGWDVGSWSA